MIALKNISKQYAGRALFSEANFDVLPGEKIGLVGRNGHGKTTLFRIITGEESPDSGTVTIPKQYSIGYLGQHLKFTKATVLEEGAVGLPVDEKDAEWKVEKILSGLGFGEEDFRRSPAEFSGGFQMRIALAKVLLSEPNMLLLDEPTNFLDIISIRWLEKFLQSWKGEIIVISHDRDLIDSVTTHIVGIHRGVMRKMRGKTAKYYAQLHKDEEIYEKRRLEDEKKRKQVMEYVNTFRSKASHAKGVQSSLKRLEKMEKLDKLEGIRTLSFSFTHAPFRAPQILQAEGLTFSYTGAEPYLIRDLSFSVSGDDKICIIGKNGRGKTTLLKLLAGKLKPLSGIVKTQVGALPAYYEQANTADLNDDRTVEEEIGAACVTSIDRTRVRGICGAMMFPGDDAEKKIRILSGGERSRVLLGKLLVAPANILFLDEPTHHLDIESCQAMIDAVRDFEGAALVAAHDEHFLHEVATKLIVFQKDGPSFYPGTYKEFLEDIGWEEDEDTPRIKVNVRKEDRKARAHAVAMRSRKFRPLEEKIKSLEQAIVSSETRLAAVNEEMARVSEQADVKRLQELSTELNELTENIDKYYTELHTVTEEYEALKKTLS
ncbi:MAG: ABC-F family ATP-binding cassette domain-containing protein [Candidatus Omnitrophica bacterium]|nr:ABC-F family ATP-binding cassette domain-containing protein [Candidatus Omnitrophota bacterium]